MILFLKCIYNYIIKVKNMEKVEVNHPILYFDATGSVLKNVKRQKKKFYIL